MYLKFAFEDSQDLNTKYEIFTTPNFNNCPCCRTAITLKQYCEDFEILLKKVDGVVFVVDSQKSELQENISYLKIFRDVLERNAINGLPLVMQWNKRDLPNILSRDVLEEKMNHFQAPSLESIATQGKGVLESLTECTRLIQNL